MNLTDRVSDFSTRLGASLKSCVKILTQSRICGIRRHPADEGDALVILANGPSLRATIAKKESVMLRMPCMAVNFAANAPELQKLKPRYYV
ncbi:MAG: hypothetical protein K2M12_07725, partial [Muribaculaceae bacterium]|nr:hypothetical protein [Muribaculaceae bacterium]